MIRLDDAHAMLGDAIGAAAGEAAAAHAAFEKKRASGEVGFPDTATAKGVVEACDAAARSLPQEVEDVVVLGIGGSSLGGRALYQALAHPHHGLLPRAKRGGRRLFFPDNVDPATWLALVDVLRPASTAFVVVSKSGGTVETLAHLALARQWLDRALGEAEGRRRLVFVTDPEKGPLREQARREGIVALDVPPNVGGRWSVLTAVGLFPACLAGIDIAGMLRGAAEQFSASGSADPSANVALRLALTHVLHDRRGRRVHVLMPYADGLRAAGEWFRQLWAESLGKSEKVGPTPVACVGATDQHSQLQLLRAGPDDKLVTFVAVDAGPDVAIPDANLAPSLGRLLDAERRATAASLAAGGRPSVTLHLPSLDAPSVGVLLMCLMLATAYAAELYGVNAYDQPAVEEGKRLARAFLDDDAARR